MALPFHDACQEVSGPVWLSQDGADVPLCGPWVLTGSSTPPIACSCFFFFFLRAEVGANGMVLELRRCKGI